MRTTRVRIVGYSLLDRQTCNSRWYFCAIYVNGVMSTMSRMTLRYLYRNHTISPLLSLGRLACLHHISAVQAVYVPYRSCFVQMFFLLSAWGEKETYLTVKKKKEKEKEKKGVL